MGFSPNSIKSIKSVYVLFALFTIILFSCKSKEKSNSEVKKNEGQVENLNSSKRIGISAPIVNNTGVPTIETAGKPSSVNIGKPSVVSVSANLFSVSAVKSNGVGSPQITTPGRDNVVSIQPVSAKAKQIICKQPIPVNALPMRIKDNSLYNILYMDIEMGMNGKVVNAICEDRNGTIWLGTQMGGLSKYDGKTFTFYSAKEGFTSNNINTIIEDNAGFIWIGCNDGVYKFDGKTFFKYTEKEGLCNNSVFHILEDKSNFIWFGTSRGLCKYDRESETFTNYTQREGFSNNAIQSIFEDKNSELWFGTYNDGLFKLSGKSFTHYTKQNGLIGDVVYSICQDNNGNYWLGTEKGLCMYDNNSFYSYNSNFGDIICSTKDTLGNLWFGSRDNGLIKYDKHNFTQYTEKDGLSSNYINTLFEDKSNNLWLGTNGGVNKFALKSFVSLEENGLLEAGSMPIAEDKEGGIWIGTNGEKLGYYDGKSFSIYNKPFLTSNKYPASTSCIVRDKNNNIWFGTNGGGAYKYDGNSFVKYTTSEGLIDNNVNAIATDREGNIWFGTNFGVSKFDSKTFTTYTEKDGLINNGVYSIIEDNAHNYWFGTKEGLSKFDKKSFTNYTTDQGLISNSIHSMIEDKSFNIWIATDSGLSYYNPTIEGVGTTPFTNYTEKEGLSSKSISAVLEDSHSNIWITTNKGMDILTRDQLDNSSGIPSFINLSKADGLKGNEFNTNSAFIDSKGRAWWGSAKALTMLDLKTFYLPSQAPNVHLTNIDLEQKFIDYNILKDTISKGGNFMIGSGKNRKNLNEIKFGDVVTFFNYPLNLVLPNNFNYLTFHFSAIDWTAPHKIQYQFMLQPMDKDWCDNTTSSVADYRNLPPGQYTFKVKAMGIANKWSDPKEVSFTILSPWYKQWWVQGLAFCFALVIIWLLFNWRTASLRNKQKELEQIVFERTAEVVAEKKEVEKQKEVVEQKNKEITDSIEYALRIQSAILPANRIVKQYLDESFILYKPKDIVAGDFYWMETLPSNSKHSATILFAACDCTGHGVPGAMVSVVCHNALNRAVREFDLTRPASILDKTAEIVIEAFSKSEEEIKDGMDISLVSITYKDQSDKVEVEWAGANNALWLMQKGELQETKADKQPIGMYDNNKPFTNHHFTLTKGDVIYLFTDGYADQFGGETGQKKLTRKRFKDLLQTIQDQSMHQQEQYLDKFIVDYRKDLEQIDDILVMGVKL